MPEVPHKCRSTLIEKLEDSDSEGLEGSVGIAPLILNIGARWW